MRNRHHVLDVHDVESLQQFLQNTIIFPTVSASPTASAVREVRVLPMTNPAKFHAKIPKKRQLSIG